MDKTKEVKDAIEVLRVKKHIGIPELQYARVPVSHIVNSMMDTVSREIATGVESTVRVNWESNNGLVADAAMGITHYPVQVSDVLCALDNLYTALASAYTAEEQTRAYKANLVKVRGAYGALKLAMESTSPAGDSFDAAVAMAEAMKQEAVPNPFDKSDRSLEETYDEEVIQMTELFSEDTDEALGQLTALVLRMGPAALWFQKSGKPIRIKDMSDSHLLNATNYLPRKDDYATNPLWRAYGRLMLRELARRDKYSESEEDHEVPSTLSQKVNAIYTVVTKTSSALTELLKAEEEREKERDRMEKAALDELDGQGGR